MNIELGGGHILQPGWVNLDPGPSGTPGWRMPAQQTPWPTGDGSVGAMRASHVMEHIPDGQPRIDVMNEAHRVLAPGGTFEIIVPVLKPLMGNTAAWDAIEPLLKKLVGETDDWNEIVSVLKPLFGAGISWESIADPTHVSFWCLESFHYFDGSFAANADYGLKYWTTLELAPWINPNTGQPHPHICRWVGTPR